MLATEVRLLCFIVGHKRMMHHASTVIQRLTRRQLSTKLNATALESLAAKDGPVLIISCLKDGAARGGSSSATTEHRVATLRPHRKGLLLGDPTVHTFERITIDEHPTGAAALTALTAGKPHAESSVVLAATKSEAFSGLSTFRGLPSDHGAGDGRESRTPESCPFINEASAQPEAWHALHSEPSAHMLAFNLIRIPDPDAYRHYSSHFRELPARCMLPGLEARAGEFSVLLNPLTLVRSLRDRWHALRRGRTPGPEPAAVRPLRLHSLASRRVPPHGACLFSILRGIHQRLVGPGARHERISASRADDPRWFRARVAPLRG